MAGEGLLPRPLCPTAGEGLLVVVLNWVLEWRESWILCTMLIEGEGLLLAPPESWGTLDRGGLTLI